MILQDKNVHTLAFIPSNELPVGVGLEDNNCFVITQSASLHLKKYFLNDSPSASVAFNQNIKIININYSSAQKGYMLTPYNSLGACILLKNQAATTLYPKLNCNRGLLRSVHQEDSKLIYVFPNHILTSNPEGACIQTLLCDGTVMYIDYCISAEYGVLLFWKNGQYFLKITCDGHVDFCTPLEQGFIPRSMCLHMQNEDGQIEAYICATHKNDFIVLQYLFSLL